jgi:hypothetical protein
MITVTIPPATLTTVQRFNDNVAQCNVYIRNAMLLSGVHYGQYAELRQAAVVVGYMYP